MFLHNPVYIFEYCGPLLPCQPKSHWMFNPTNVPNITPVWRNYSEGLDLVWLKTIVRFIYGRWRDVFVLRDPICYLVSWLALWAQSTTKDYIRAEHKLYFISKSFSSQVIIPQVMFFLAYLYSAGTQHGNLHPAGWPILFCRPTQEPVLATANTGTNREKFLKKCKWMDWKGRNKRGRRPWL